METFAERLKRLMVSAGLNDTNIAFLLGISAQRTENLLTGYSEADIDIVTRVAEIFNVSCAYAAAKSEEKEIKETNSKEIFVAERLDPVSGMMLLKDVVGTAYIDKSELHGKDYIGLIVKDDGMVKARMFEGDMVIVRRQKFADNGDAVAVLTDGGNYIVRRYNRTGNIVVLTAEGDAMKYPAIKIDTTETKFNIIGRVCECRIKF